MKSLFILCLFLSSSAFAAGSFDGKWVGRGTLITSTGTQKCDYAVFFSQSSADVTLQTIFRYCDSLPGEGVGYSYSSVGSKVYDIVGNEVGDFSGDKLHVLATWSDSSVNEITFQLKNGVIEYSQQLNRPSTPSQSFKAEGTLTKN